MNIEKARILDCILLKFTGNTTVKWVDLQKGIWDDIASYHVCENNINFLIGDNQIKRNTEKEELSLTDKGFATMTDLKNLGYVTRHKKSKYVRFISLVTVIITIATFLILIYDTFIRNSVSDPIPLHRQDPSKLNERIPSTLKDHETPGDSVNNNAIKPDTIPKSPK